MVLDKEEYMFTVGIITASDKGAQGLREDVSGALLRTLLEEAGYQVVTYEIVADEEEQLEASMKKMCDEDHVDLLVTTGGTGFSQRDVTPEATKKVITKETPGIVEAMRYYSLQITPRAMLSRAVAGIRNQTLIINLPGSPKAVKENLSFILPSLTHGLEIMIGSAKECGGK